MFIPPPLEKNCSKCKAFESLKCNLGYVSEGGVPKEPCPKPMVYLDYIELVKDISNKNNKGC